ncbi:FeoB-associated Cys-rich membrane protein [Desulfosporosinus fructosivorans]
MINWILGSIIVGVTAFIILRTVGRMRKGGSACCGGCTQGGCSEAKCDCTK